MINTIRYAGLAVVFVWFFGGGITHFTNADFFIAIVPPWWPWPLLAVYASGVFQVLLAILIVWPKTRSLAGGGWWGAAGPEMPTDTTYHRVCLVCPGR